MNLFKETLKQQRVLFSEISILSVVVTQETEHDVFIDYVAHCNYFSIRFFYNGWESNKENIITEFHFLEKDDAMELTEKESEYYLQPFLKAKNNLKEILIKKGNCNHLLTKIVEVKVKTLI